MPISRTRTTLGALCIVLALCLAAVCQSQPPATAQEILSQATARAAAEHKQVFLVFGASWCSYCRLLDAFFADPKIQPIIDHNFVVVHLSVLESKHPERNTPGGEKLLAELAAPPEGADYGLPVFVFLDGKGVLLTTSMRPSEKSKNGENIGYPVEPQEIDWFMTMMRKSVPAMSAADSSVIESYLKTRATAIQGAH